MVRVFFFKRRCQEQEHKSERARIALSGQLSWMDQFNLDLDLAWTYPDRKIQAYWEHLRHSSVWPWLMFYLFSVAMQGMNTRSTVLYVMAILIGNVQCLIDAIKMRSSIFLWVLFFRRLLFGRFRFSTTFQRWGVDLRMTPYQISIAQYDRRPTMRRSPPTAACEGTTFDLWFWTFTCSILNQPKSIFNMELPVPDQLQKQLEKCKTIREVDHHKSRTKTPKVSYVTCRYL